MYSQYILHNSLPVYLFILGFTIHRCGLALHQFVETNYWCDYFVVSVGFFREHCFFLTSSTVFDLKYIIKISFDGIIDV